MSTWYKPTDHGWKHYRGTTGMYKGRGRGTISVKPRTMWHNWNVRKAKVKQNVGLRSFWFKTITYLQSDLAGYVSNAPGISTNSAQLASDFGKMALNFMQYKVVKIIVRWIPTNLGTNGAQELAGPQIGRVLYQRGTFIGWSTIDASEPYPLNVDEVIAKPSTKIVNPMRQYRRYLKRPSGYPDWGTLSDTGGVVVPDEWQSSLRVFGEGFTPTQATGQQRFFIQVAQFQVVFRGRRGE